MRIVSSAIEDMYNRKRKYEMHPTFKMNIPIKMPYHIQPAPISIVDRQMDKKTDFPKKIIVTESHNPASHNIDIVSTEEMVKLINNEDKKVALAVEAEAPKIAKAIDMIVEGMKKGGSLLYFGAGTSGRLGVLDASEAPPTYGVSPNLIRGYIAGGDHALRNSIEGSEDNMKDALETFLKASQSNHDVVVGISASGNPPYVVGLLEHAKNMGRKTIAITSNPEGKSLKFADVGIVTDIGPEVITGSSRMKSGTAHKLVLNTLTTGAMVRLGKTYHNYMIDVQPKNQKLVDRSIRIISELADINYTAASEYFYKAEKRVKDAVVMAKLGVDLETARQMLNTYDGVLRKLLIAKGIK